MQNSSLKLAVVFHSVCGNTCQLARHLAQALEHRGARVQLYRLYDPNYTVTAESFPAARASKADILGIPLLESPAPLLGCDGILMGSPTYFGNVSAPVKVFIDSFVDYYTSAPFVGKLFGSFATAGTAQGGADFTLLALNTFAMHVGMTVIPVPSGTAAPQPAYGLAHYSGDQADHRLTENEKSAISQYVAHFCTLAAAMAAVKE